MAQQNLILCIDIGGDSIKAAEFSYVPGQSLTLERFAYTEYEFSSDEPPEDIILKTLTDVKMASDFALKYQGKKVDFEKLGYEDREVYDMIGNGETDTVFQLESGGMKNFMRQLRPTLLEEIIAGVSLYRPGPMDYIPKYVYNKMHQSEIDYRNPLLKPILQTTYGIVVYQEQAMRITQVLAGYTLNEADNFRKLISKKKTDLLPIEMKKFVGGCVSHGISEDFAVTIWKELESFGNYAFNKSHAAAYSVLTYQTAYLKHYFPVEYLCAVMNNRINNPDDTTKYLKLIKDMGIKLLPPDINESEGLFLPENGGIRYGLICIKNVGRAAVDGVVKERKQNGKFTDFSDFVRRVPMDALNKRMIESLIMGGAFDCFGKNRATLMGNYEFIMDVEMKSKDLLEGGQMFFDFMVQDSYQYKELQENRKLRLMNEKEVLGRYLSGHPLDGYEEEFKKFNFNTTMLLPINEDEDESDGGDDDPDNFVYQVKNGDRVSFGGLLSGVTMKVSKSGQRWGVATLEDFYGSTEVVFYAQVIADCKQYLTDDALVRVTGRIKISDERGPKVELTSVRPWVLEEKEEIIDDRTLCIRIQNDLDKYNQVMKFLEEHVGSGAHVIIQVETVKPDGSIDKKGYKMPFTIKDADAVKSSLIGIVGFNNVKLV